LPNIEGFLLGDSVIISNWVNF